MWGWAAEEGTLAAGTVITWVDDIPCSDRATMVTLLAAAGGESHQLMVAVDWLMVEEWIVYPRIRDILI